MATIVSQILTKIRRKLKDSGKLIYSDAELIEYVNDSIDFVTSELISLGDPEMINEVTMSSGDTIPDDYFSLVGIHKVYMKAGCLYHLDNQSSFSIRYFATKSKVTKETDTLPHKPIYDVVIVNLAAIYATNRDNLGVSQDSQLLQQLRQLIDTGKIKASGQQPQVVQKG